MTDTLAMTTARMLREHFHTSGMTKEVAELDEAIAAEQPAKDGDSFGKAAETHNG